MRQGVRKVALIQPSLANRAEYGLKLGTAKLLFHLCECIAVPAAGIAQRKETAVIV